MGILGVVWQVDNIFSAIGKEVPKYLKFTNIQKLVLISINTFGLGAI
jgi:hypothetical protein